MNNVSTNIAIAALDAEIAIMKLQVSLANVKNIDLIREELERSLHIVGRIKKAVCAGK